MKAQHYVLLCQGGAGTTTLTAAVYAFNDQDATNKAKELSMDIAGQKYYTFSVHKKDELKYITRWDVALVPTIRQFTKF